MSADADHWWRNKRDASVNSGDAWSGGGRAYRTWMGVEPERDRPAPARADQTAVASAAERRTPPEPAPVQAEQIAVARVCERGGRSVVPRAPRFSRTRRLRNAARPARSVAEALLFVLAGVPLAWFKGRKRFRVLGLGAAGVAAVVFLAPLAWAGLLGPCAAAETALVDEAVSRGSRFEANKRRVANWVGPDGKLLSRGRVGRQTAAEEHAGWPPPVGCTALFWRVRSEGASLGGISLLRFAPAVARR